MPIERGEDCSDTVIGAFQHADVILTCRGFFVIGTLGESLVTFCAGLWYCVRVCRSMVGRLEWPVNCVIGDLKKERPSRVVIDKAYRAPGYFIRQILRDFDRCRVFKEIRCPVAAPMCVVIHSAAEEAEKLIEAVGVGTELGFEPKVPFADKTGRIAVRL